MCWSVCLCVCVGGGVGSKKAWKTRVFYCGRVVFESHGFGVVKCRTQICTILFLDFDEKAFFPDIG